MRLVYRAGTAPLHPLADVIRLAHLSRVGATVSQRLALDLGIGAAEAEGRIRIGLCALNKDCFVVTLPLDFDDGAVDADIYGVLDDDGGWYVKLYMEGGRVIVTSWHCPKDELVRADGKSVR
jgi:hypothetical protein